MPLAYFKDRFLPEEDCHISIHDRSFRFGDGVFETLLVVSGAMVDFPVHQERLRNGLATFRITLDIEGIEPICREVIRRNGLREGFLRIVVSRGENRLGAVGYLPKGCVPYLLIQAVEKPYPAFGSVTLWVSAQHPVMQLPSKTNNALIYTLAMLEAEEKGCGNALLLDGDGQLCETASGNLFWITGNTLYTPSLDLPLVPGTVRKRILALWDGPKKEGRYGLEALANADEIFMSNIGGLITAVTGISPLGIARPSGMQTARLRAVLDADIRTAIDKTLENAAKIY